MADIRLAANCHLHFDHCGGNPLLGDVPVFVQRTELDAARGEENYTLPWLLEGSRFSQLAGEAEILPGVALIPTPGHTAGHQSLVVRRPDGAVIVAGQSHDTASGYAADQLSSRSGAACCSGSTRGSSTSRMTARPGRREGPARGSRTGLGRAAPALNSKKSHNVSAETLLRTS